MCSKPLTLIRVGEDVILHPSPLADIRAKVGIPNSPQSPDIEQNSNGVISDFRISGQSLIKENCHNSRTSHDIDCKTNT